MDAGRWSERLAESTEKHGVPGAALGILRMSPDDPGGDELVATASGILNTATGVTATPESVFQIGSMAKAMTATVAMRLVDRGDLEPDVPVAGYLPELRLSDAGVTERVTLRHLLTHTSGIDGDVFTDTGRGDDCLERYVAGLAEVGQNHPLGATFSYCNSGYVLLGRLIEKITGRVFDTAMRDLLFDPLGLDRTATLPEDVLMHRAAIGHHEVEGRARPVGQWGMPRSGTPAGTNISCDVRDVLAFARLHLADGRTADGTRLLTAESARLMRERHTDLPDPYTLGDSWGLGLIRYRWDGRRVFGHDGNTIGQAAYLRFLPDAGLAVTLLTNGGHAGDLFQDLVTEILAAEAGVAVPRPFAPPAEPAEVDHRPYLGTYERASMRLDVFERDGGPWLRATVTGPLAELEPGPPEEHALVPVRDGLFAMHTEGEFPWTPVTFYRLADGSPYVHLGVRATPKIS